ncbi:MarR family winged helix-turn-helix transcriptional regulator [Paenibacillus sp.]|uniref:MarR family winged helix-turn-helix transcriptional regulator n=1 Tax=Paenibacillus sp. TaxID=58172 RepID=UPI002D68E6FE|nr:MarR family transcriptional regulator [Paenibacillus sp.]HZG58726.1 MarR family transcriptional regulator [Paenibacillus sp.]
MRTEDVLELRSAVQQFIRSFGLLEQTKTPCGFSLSLSQVFALQELEKQTLTVTELADKLRLERSTVSRLVDGLVKGGFVTRAPNELNRREVILSLTEKGERSIGKVREQSVEFYSTILGRMTEAEQAQVLESFKAFNRSLREVRKDAALAESAHS